MRNSRTYYLSFTSILISVLILMYIAIPGLQNRYYSKYVRIVADNPRNQNKNTKEEKSRDKYGSSETRDRDYILHPVNLCGRGTSRIQFDFLVLISSSPKNVNKRNAIRETWASQLKQESNSRTSFLLARTEDVNVQSSVESESYLHSDIIQGTFIDHYHNLTLKIKMMLRWALDYCPNVSFHVKSDDDTFVNVKNFLKVMKNKRKDAIHGRVYANAQPIRNQSSKWYVPPKQYNGTVYPSYVSGAFYALGGDIVRRLHQASEQVPLFWIEDVFLTGFVAQKAEVERIDEKAISYEMKSACGVREKAASHYVTAKMMRHFWYQIHFSLLKC